MPHKFTGRIIKGAIPFFQAGEKSGGLLIENDLQVAARSILWGHDSSPLGPCGILPPHNIQTGSIHADSLRRQ